MVTDTEDTEFVIVVWGNRERRGVGGWGEETGRHTSQLYNLLDFALKALLCVHGL